MTSRPLFTIAREISIDWKKPYFGADPYIKAMKELTNVTDKYYFDSGVSIVCGFLANANTWRGENAKRIKAELKAMLKA